MTGMNISAKLNRVCHIQYADYEAYPDVYHEAKSIISDIYTMNCDKFDKIIAEF